MTRLNSLVLSLSLLALAANAATPEPQPSPAPQQQQPVAAKPKDGPIFKADRLARKLMAVLAITYSVSGVGDLPFDLDDLIPRGGGHVGSGGGRGEQNIVYATQNFSSFVERCLQTPGCAENDEEKELLRLLGNQLMGMGAGFLRFETEQENPLRWQRRNVPMLLELGQLFVNKDRLLVEVPGQEPHPLDVSEAAALILRHCTAFYEKSENLAARFLSTLQKSKPEELALTQIGRDQIRLLMLKDASDKFTRLTLLDEEHSFNLTQMVSDHVMNWLEATEVNPKIETLTMTHFVWDRLALPANNQQKISATGNLALSVLATVDGRPARIQYSGRVTVGFAVSLRTKQSALLPMKEGWYLEPATPEQLLKVNEGSTRVRLSFQSEGYTEYLSCEQRLGGNGS